MDNNKVQSSVYPLVIAGLLLLIAIASLPSGFYVFLRWAVSLTAGYYAYFVYTRHHANINLSFWALVIVVLVFNPIVPIYLHDKSIWIVIDLATIPALLWGYIKSK